MLILHLARLYRTAWELLDALSECDLDELELYRMTRISRAHVHWTMSAFSETLRTLLTDSSVLAQRRQELKVSTGGAAYAAQQVSVRVDSPGPPGKVEVLRIKSPGLKAATQSEASNRATGYTGKPLVEGRYGREYVLDLGAAGGLDTTYALTLGYRVEAVEGGRKALQVLQNRHMQSNFPNHLETQMIHIVPSRNETFRRVESSGWMTVARTNEQAKKIVEESRALYRAQYERGRRLQDKGVTPSGEGTTTAIKGQGKSNKVNDGVVAQEHQALDDSASPMTGQASTVNNDEPLLRDVIQPTLDFNKTRTCHEYYREIAQKHGWRGAVSVKIDLEGLDLGCFKQLLQLGRLPLGVRSEEAARPEVDLEDAATPNGQKSYSTSATLLPQFISLEIFSIETAIGAIRAAFEKGYRYMKIVEQSAYFRLICNQRMRGRDGVYGNPRRQQRIFSSDGRKVSRMVMGPMCFTESGSGPPGDDALDYMTGPLWRRIEWPYTVLDQTDEQEVDEIVEPEPDSRGHSRSGLGGGRGSRRLLPRNQVRPLFEELYNSVKGRDDRNSSTTTSPRGHLVLQSENSTTQLLDLYMELSLILGDLKRMDSTGLLWAASHVLRELDGNTFVRFDLHFKL
ncbi:unnamed protein product [Amoebophrya sp. A25]|nr:unnamed protein product [Amoebophrya sp. A25]|eukprot:GSA25T00015220001.1